jgi:phenol 2-monooxygenase
MNISMQDSHNLAWKLAYAVLGLTPNLVELLCTYEAERRPIASDVVFFDKRWNQSDMPREQKLKEGSDQLLGCGVEYKENLVVAAREEELGGSGAKHPVSGTGYMKGVLRTGRRLLNVQLKRFADGSMLDIHDDLLANGRYRVVVICGEDFPNAEGRSSSAVTSVCGDIIKEFPAGMVEVIILQPDLSPTWEFDDLPACIKEEAEMRLYCAGGEVYETYGLDVKRGAIVLVRPDGMVGMVTNLEDVAMLTDMLRRVLVTV